MPHANEGDSVTRAEALKAQGNEKYKGGGLRDAIKLYKAAVALQPNVPVYLSNLSAALLEDGQYQDSLEACDAALQLLSTNEGEAALRRRLQSRRVKVLLLLYAGDSTVPTEAIDASNDMPLQKAALGRLEESRRDDVLTKQRLSSMPRYRHRARNIYEYYSVGHDMANSIFRTQYNGMEDLPEAQESTYAEELHMKLPRDGTPFEFSALFGGVGDARHVYESIADVGVDLASFKKKKARDVKIHFCCIDIHPTALARDLVVMTALDKLSKLPGPSRATSTEPRALELLLMLHYVFWGTTMPPAAQSTLDEIVKEVYRTVSAAAEKDEAFVMDWLYVEKSTVKLVLPRLKWWLGEGKTVLAFDTIVPDRITSDPEDQQDIPGEKNKATAQERLEEKRRQNVEQLRSDATRSDPEALANAKKAGLSIDEYIEELVKYALKDDGRVERLRSAPPNAVQEREAFTTLKVMVPPAHANEPEEIDDIFDDIRTNEWKFFPPREYLDAVHEYVRKQWLPNYTLLDKYWLASQDYKQLFNQCPFQGVQSMLSPHYLGAHRPTATDGSSGLYDWSAAFFGLVADGLARLVQYGYLTVEMVHGDAFNGMDKIRAGTMERDTSFPTQFDRIHASNVPDYVGGYLASFTTAIPLLKPVKTSYFTSCSLLNSSRWEGGFRDPTTFDKNLDSALWTYLGITAEELDAACGVEMLGKPCYIGNYMMFRPSTKPSSHLTRKKLNRVVYTTLWRTVLPARYKRYGDPLTIRESQNIPAFFRLLERLKDLKYPIHVLADYVECILENRVTNGYAPHRVTPIPLSNCLDAPCVVSTLPFIAEFEVAAALWEPKLFPICSAALPALSSLVRYGTKIKVEEIQRSVPFDHQVLALAFGKPKDLDVGVVDPRDRVVGSTISKSPLHFVSTFKLDHNAETVTFLLTNARMATFIQEGFEVALVNTSLWRLQSGKVKCLDLQVIGHVDREDEVHNKWPPLRPLSDADRHGWHWDMQLTGGWR